MRRDPNSTSAALVPRGKDGGAAITRRLPMGAEVQPGGGVHFRVWAPDHRRVRVLVEDSSDRAGGAEWLESEPDGYFAGTVAYAAAGSRYVYQLDEDETRYPDPASRFQPLGPHGPSQVVDPAAFRWTDQDWRGISIPGQVLYEMHVGTFTRSGTWSAAIDHLGSLAALGVTALEVMPVAEFAGRFGWGYDGVDLYAPTHLYGEPDDFRRFVDAAHRVGLGVVLDVVYNHLGPDGNFLPQFARRYFSSRRETEWGAAINYDEEAANVRQFIAGNAAYWIDEFHLDGLRFDATQQLFDESREHILSECVRRARGAANGRAVLFVAENEPQDTTLLRPADDGGCGLDALWNDDFHHTARVRLTGRRDAYCSDYTGSAQELLSLAKWGFLYQGQRYQWQQKARGTPTFGLAPARFVTFLENHDQVANRASGRGERQHQAVDLSTFRAMTAFWLLAPGTPMLFQGQEFASTAPFLYFADHEGSLRDAVRNGRADFMKQFASLATRDIHRVLPDPAERSTFERCVLSDVERGAEGPIYALHRDLLRLRREDAAFRAAQQGWVDGAVLGPDMFVLRCFSSDPRAPASISTSFSNDRLVIVNFGVDAFVAPASEPLLAPPRRTAWSLRWSSEDPAYGGIGTPAFDPADTWRIPGHATIVLAPRTT